MKVLVTGATGFVGSWLTRRLLDEGHEVRVLRRERSDLDEIKNLRVEHTLGDVSDSGAVDQAVTNQDLVFHLAGLVGYSRAMRPAMILANVVGTNNIVESCAKHGVKKLVYLSSVVAVGASFDGKAPLDENSDYNLSHLDLGYFETKRKAEEIVLEAARKNRIQAVALNPSTIYGPGDAKKGSRKVQVKVAQGKFPFYPPGGVNVISVEDVVDAIVASIDLGRSGERYILAGENLLIKDVFRLIAHEAGVAPPRIKLPGWLVHAIGRYGDYLEKKDKKGPINSENAWASTLYHWFDASKAKAELGFNPKPAAYAIKQSVDWMKNNGLLDSLNG